MSLPLAHAGHWALYVLYAVPAIIVLVATIHSLVAQRRQNRDEPDPRPAELGDLTQHGARHKLDRQSRAKESQ